MNMLTSISGYPEWLPEDRLVEQSFIRLVQSKFELHGFAPIDTRAVEPIPTLLTKGESDKEIYSLRRLQAPHDEPDQEIGLHFDLTVPFARYVVENKNRLTFPFRRYQIQKAWRGERPGLGRYREFLQADIDIVADSSLTLCQDLEIIQTVSEVLSSLPIPQVRMLVNNRKILEGFYRSVGNTRVAESLRIVDKLRKIGERQVYQLLVDNVGLSPSVATKCLEFANILTQDTDVLHAALRHLGARDELIDEGVSELGYILNACGKQRTNSVFADLSIVRGLDYYTGTVCEAKFAQFPRYPAVAAGGRYDNLVSDEYSKLPGVGMSLGVTRILGLVLHEGILGASRKTPTCVLVALVSEETRGRSLQIAGTLRSRAISCEAYPYPLRYGKQIKYAERLGIPYVWFPSEGIEDIDQVRDIRSGIQVPADANTWMPPAADLSFRVESNNLHFERVLNESAYR